MQGRVMTKALILMKCIVCVCQWVFGGEIDADRQIDRQKDRQRERAREREREKERERERERGGECEDEREKTKPQNNANMSLLKCLT